MCDVKQETPIIDEVWHAMTALMQPYDPIPGLEEELFIPDKDRNAAHAYEHLRAAHSKLWEQEHRSCACTAAAVVGDMCMECYLNSAIEGEDYVWHNNKLFIQHA
ncbi:MAG: hypothetical protein ACQ5SW_07770 [Sphaerochaetaceae bacterium]